jgi:hypothetical protein
MASVGELNGEPTEVVQARQRIAQRIGERAEWESAVWSYEQRRASLVVSVFDGAAFSLALFAFWILVFLNRSDQNFILYSWILLSAVVTFMARFVVLWNAEKSPSRP